LSYSNSRLDAQNLIKALQSMDLDGTLEGVIYRDMRAFMHLNFISVTFSYCLRGCNKLAHDLAAYGVRGHELQSC
jgi:hypothetical protein